MVPYLEKEVAEERIAARNKVIARFQSQIEEREAAMLLREKVGEILLPAIGAVVGNITNAMKTLGKDLGNGLKAVGKQAASALPGLIGSIVSFLFKTAGQAISYLAEDTCLLILAVVVFVVETYLKR